MSGTFHIVSNSRTLPTKIAEKITVFARQHGTPIPHHIQCDIGDFGGVLLMDGHVQSEYLALMGAPKFPNTKEGIIEAAKWLEAETGELVQAVVHYVYHGGCRDQQIYPPLPKRNIKGLAYDREDGKVFVTGKTFEVKDDLKAMGFRWNPRRKAWFVTEARWEDVEERVDALCKSLGGTVAPKRED
jgi:hypothetical protein